MTNFSWRNAPDLMQRLNDTQNHPANDSQDITTIVGFFTSREEMERHVVFYEQKAAAWVPKPRRRKAA